LFGVFGDEVPALRHLLNQKRDSLDVRFDCLQGVGVINERQHVAHRACQVNDLVVPIFLAYEHLYEMPSVTSGCTKIEQQTHPVRS
jgi:hypothetical protein